MGFEESGFVMWKMCCDTWRLGYFVYKGSPMFAAKVIRFERVMRAGGMEWGRARLSPK